MGQRPQHRVRRRLPEPADGRIDHQPGQPVQLRGVPAILFEQPEHLDRADATRRALAAGLVGEEGHQAGQRGAQVVVLREDDDGAEPMKQP